MSNDAVVRRVFDEAWNQKKINIIDETHASGYAFHDPASPGIDSPEAYKGFLNTYHNGFPDTHFTVEEVICSGENVVVRFSITSTHTGELRGIPPSNKKIAITGISVFRMANGKIAEEWCNWDTLGMLQQIGVIPPME